MYIKFIIITCYQYYKMLSISTFKIIYYFYLEHSGRGRKAKNEDPNEHQITPNVMHKKRAAIESRHL